MLYSYYKKQFTNISGGNNYLGLLYKLTQHQTYKLAICENTSQGPDLIITNFPADLLVRGYLKKQKRRFLPCYSSNISCSYLSFDVLPLVSPLIWLMESTPPESDRNRHCPASGISSMYAKWNALTDVLGSSSVDDGARKWNYELDQSAERQIEHRKSVRSLSRRQLTFPFCC